MAVALGDEMVDQQPGGFRVVDADDVLRPRRPGAVDQHDGKSKSIAPSFSAIVRVGA